MSDRDDAMLSADDRFVHLDSIVAEPLRFKIKLAIGEDAYASLRLKNAVVQAWDVAGVATTAAVVAKSSLVASTFFAPTGWLAAIGLGTAVTPIGWVVAAGVLSGGAWYGVTRHLKKATADRVSVVPHFINTPLDVLALGLFDLMMPMALNLVNGDAVGREQSRSRIHSYFVSEWGYDAEFVEAGMAHLESQPAPVSIEAQAKTLAEFASQNPDCNFERMSGEILGFLREISAAGQAEANEAALADIEMQFKRARGSRASRRMRALVGLISRRSMQLFRRRRR